jgi:AraC-like DNA-binding protein/tetratricopeptide (TPR) repeat protein
MDGQVQATNSEERCGVVPQHVRRALVYLEAHIAASITVSDLASACGVQERTLQRQFQRFVGLSPLAYLRRLRLNRARSALDDPDHVDDTVSEIATRCGFTHSSRFAAEYRQLFGETPSTTRARARTRAVPAPTDRHSTTSSLTFPTIAAQPTPSLRIMPFRSETLQEALQARDLAERLAATLSRMRVARVTLATSPRTAAALQPQPRNRGLEYCLLGRLSQQGERLRVVVRLVDVLADQHVLGDSFDGAANDPFEWQDRVADSVLSAAVSHITDVALARASEIDADNACARDLALQALRLLLGTSVSRAREAQALLERAIDLDPANALAIALTAYCHGQFAVYQGTPSPASARETALRFSQRAAVLDTGDPLVMTARGSAELLAQQPDRADALIARALAMDPTSAWAWERNGFNRLSINANPDLAISAFEQALRLKGPAMPRSNCYLGIATAHRCAGRNLEAIPWMQKALSENPDAAWLYREQSCLMFRLGDRAGMAKAVESLRRIQPEITVSLLMASFVHPEYGIGWCEALAETGLPL